MLPDPVLRRVVSSTHRSTSIGVRSVLMILSLTVLTLMACGSPAPSPSPSPSPSTPPPAPTATSTAEPSAEDCRRQGTVGNTDGQGVNVRAAPGDDIVTAYPDGTRVTICAEKDADGQHWFQVQGEDGGKGWVVAEYVVMGDSGG